MTLREKLPAIQSCKVEPKHFGPRGLESREECPICAVGAVLSSFRLEAYKAAIDADEAYQADLEDQFGARAGDMRYSYHADEPLATLQKEYRRKVRNWIESMRDTFPEVVIEPKW